MKWLLYGLAGLAGVIVLSVVVLLALSSGQSRLTASVDVARPPDVVFAWLTEPERVKRWVGWLKEIRPITARQQKQARDRSGSWKTVTTTIS